MKFMLMIKVHTKEGGGLLKTLKCTALQFIVKKK